MTFTSVRPTHLGLLLLCVYVLQAVHDEANDSSPEADFNRVLSPESPPAIYLLSPKAMETAGCIIRFEEEQREKAKVRQRSQNAAVWLMFRQGDCKLHRIENLKFMRLLLLVTTVTVLIIEDTRRILSRVLSLILSRLLYYQASEHFLV